MKTSDSRRMREFIENKQSVWSSTTYKNALYELETLNSLGFPEIPPQEMFKTMMLRFGRYTVKQLFVRATQLERHVLKSTHYRDWVRDNNSAFRNAYEKRVRIPTSGDVSALVNYATTYNPGIVNQILLMAYTGLRKSEAAAVRWSDINRVTNELYVSNGKGRKTRHIPISPHTLSRLIPNNISYVCVPNNNIWRLIKQICHRIGVDQITPHSLRAYCISQLSGKLSVPELMDFAGHSDFKTTCKYIVTNKAQMHQKIMEVFYG